MIGKLSFNPVLTDKETGAQEIKCVVKSHKANKW